MPRQRLGNVSKKVVLVKLRPQLADPIDSIIIEQAQGLLLNVPNFVLGLDKLTFPPAQCPTGVVVKVI